MFCKKIGKLTPANVEKGYNKSTDFANGKLNQDGVGQASRFFHK